MASTHTYKDRMEAAHLLITPLADIAEQNVVVIALPRGGVILGDEIASAFRLPLDVIITRKIGAPDNPEYAIGSIDIDGVGVFNNAQIALVQQTWLAEEVERERREAERRRTLYRGTRPPLDLKGKIALIVDDGMATGLTMQSAVRYAKKIGAARVIVAVPVAPKATIDKIAREAEVRTLLVPEMFFAVGQFYQNFPQVSDDEVVSILAKHQK